MTKSINASELREQLEKNWTSLEEQPGRHNIAFINTFYFIFLFPCIYFLKNYNRPKPKLKLIQFPVFDQQNEKLTKAHNELNFIKSRCDSTVCPGGTQWPKCMAEKNDKSFLRWSLKAYIYYLVALTIQNSKIL